MQILSSLLWFSDFPNVKKKFLDMFKDNTFVCVDELEE